MNARLGILLVFLPALLAAQAMVENAIGVGRAATTAAPAGKAGQAIGVAFGSLTRTLDPAEAKSEPAKSVAVRPREEVAAKAQTSQPKPKPAVLFEDPSGIQKGMEYAEIVRRFGPPSLRLTTAPGEEILSFAKKNASVDVTVRNGKVASVQKAGG